MELLSEEADFLFKKLVEVIGLGVVPEGSQKRLEEVVVGKRGAAVDVGQGVLLSRVPPRYAEGGAGPQTVTKEIFFHL